MTRFYPAKSAYYASNRNPSRTMRYKASTVPGALYRGTKEEAETEENEWAAEVGPRFLRSNYYGVHVCCVMCRFVWTVADVKTSREALLTVVRAHEKEGCDGGVQ